MDTPEDTPVHDAGEPENVVTHARFTGRAPDAPAPEPMDLSQLRKVGLATDTSRTLEDLPLIEPAYGETIIGELTPDEAALYVQFYDAHQTRKTVERQFGGGILVKLGQHVQATEEDAVVDPSTMVTEEEAVAFFRAVRRAESLKALLFWTLSERLGHHDWLLSVRTKGRVVCVRRQW